MGINEKDRKFTERFIEFILKKRFFFIAAILILSLISGIFIYKKFKLATNFFDLYPTKHPYIKTYLEFREMFGSANVIYICVAVKNGDIYTFDYLNKINGITLDLLKIEGVNPYQVSSITHPSVKKVQVSTFGISVIPFIEKIPETPGELERIKKDAFQTEGIRGGYISPDDKSSLIMAGFWEETDLSKIFDKIDEVLKKYKDSNTEIYVTGYPMLYAWIYHNQTKILSVFIITGFFLIFLLYVNFRTMRGVILPILTACLSGLLAFGFASVMNYSVDLLIMVVPILLMGRTLSHSVQCMERFYENVKLFKDKNKAIVSSYSELFPPAISGIVTDGLGVLTIAIARIPLMQKLAFIGGFWIISMVLSVLIFQPILQSFLSYSDSEVEKLHPKVLYNLINKVGLIGKNCCLGSRPKWIAIAILLIIIFGGIYTTKSLVVGDTRIGATIFYPDHPYNVSYDYINKHFWGTNEFVVIMNGGKEEALKNPELLRRLEIFCDYMGEDPLLGGSHSFIKLVQNVSRIYHEGIPKWEVIPSDSKLLSQILFLVQVNASPGEMSKFYSPDYRNASLMFYYKDYSNKIIKNVTDRAEAFIKNENTDTGTFRLAGGVMGISAAVNSEVEWSYWANLITIFGVVLLVCYLIYRSIKVILILFSSLFLAQIFCDFYMLAKGIDLNINTLPVTSIGVGVGIDYAIYMIDRIMNEFRRQGRYFLSTTVALSTTGYAIVFTAITVITSIIFWFISGIKFHTEMSTLISLLMLFNMLGAITVVPVMVILLKPFGKEKIY